jgi:uncharacterized membrane protein
MALLFQLLSFAILSAAAIYAILTDDPALSAVVFCYSVCSCSFSSVLLLHFLPVMFFQLLLFCYSFFLVLSFCCFSICYFF